MVFRQSLANFDLFRVSCLQLRYFLACAVQFKEISANLQLISAKTSVACCCWIADFSSVLIGFGFAISLLIKRLFFPMQYQKINWQICSPKFLVKDELHLFAFSTCNTDMITEHRGLCIGITSRTAAPPRFFSELKGKT